MDKRRESRVPNSIRFFVHVHECEAEPDLVGVSIACEAVDFSRHGLQLRADEALPAGTLLNVTIGISDPFMMYLLRGEVRWNRPVDDDIHATGIMLHQTPGTDFEAWEAAFDDTFV